MQRPGLPNLHQLSEDYYRGAQPTEVGMRQLAQMKVRTVINLRSLHSDRSLLKDVPVDYEHISVKPWHAEEEDVVAFLKLVTDASKAPVFVHCQHGADRTGMMTAIYRVVVQGWSKREAIREMTEGGYGYHVVWKNLVEYVEQLDVEHIRRQAGIGSK